MTAEKRERMGFRSGYWRVDCRAGYLLCGVTPALFSSVPAEEQAEFQQLSDEIQELQQLLNQDFRQKTVLVVRHLGTEDSVFVGAEGEGAHMFRK